MNAHTHTDLVTLLRDKSQEILLDWMREQKTAASLRLDLLSEKELQQQSHEFLNLLTQAVQQGNTSAIDQDDFAHVRNFLENMSSTRAAQGYTPTETANFVLSLKQPLFTLLGKEKQSDAQQLLNTVWTINFLMDKLGLYTTEQYLKTRENIIQRQQQEMLELSTPVAKLWDGILVLPLIGTLDSARTQQVMENLLQKIVDTGSSVAIIDITGIPTVDTLVAQHLIKTMSAARLMGAECIVSGIRPQIAQTMVHLGIALQDVTTKATLADAVSWAMHKAGYKVVSQK